jgi:putative transposase
MCGAGALLDERGCCSHRLRGVKPRAPTLSTTGGRNVFSISRLQLLLQQMPWGIFDKAVRQYGTDRHCKGFDSRDHLLAMTFAQLSDVRGLRELEDRFNQHHRHHYHLGTGAVKRSTLSEANCRRNPQIFAEAGAALMQYAGRAVRHEREQMLYLLDSTSITLQGRGYEWALGQATRTAGLKLHVLYASEDGRPVHHSITPANVNDVDEGKRLHIERGAIYVFDKGYCDYSWWGCFNAAGARFVTRAKTNAALTLVEQRPIAESDAGVILSDCIEQFKYKSNRGGHRNGYIGQVRRIRVARQDDQDLVLLTNDLSSPAAEIAALYKERWQIELFFKWIKQHLSVKRFLGRSENAVRIQLLVALIAYLLVLLYKAKHGLKESLWRVLCTLRGGLMHRIEPEQSPWRRRREQDAYIRSVQPQLL